MTRTIGTLFQVRIAPPIYSVRVTCPELTVNQFEFLNRSLDEEADDTYPDIANRTTTVVFTSADPEEFRDMLEEQLVGKFIRRCCDPASPLFISDAEYIAIRDE